MQKKSSFDWMSYDKELKRAGYSFRKEEYSVDELEQMGISLYDQRERMIKVFKRQGDVVLAFLLAIPFVLVFHNFSHTGAFVASSLFCSMILAILSCSFNTKEGIKEINKKLWLRSLEVE